MSWDFFERRTVKGRKPHICEHCRKTIEAGESHFSCAGRFDGQFNAYRKHLECEKAWTELHNLRGTMWDDSWPFLADDDIDAGERDWLHEHFPAVSARMFSTPTQGTAS